MLFWVIYGRAVSRHSHRRIICSYFKQMLCHDYMAFSCACQSLLIFNRFFRPIFVLGSLKGKINLIQTIVTSILTRRLEKAFLVFMKRNSNRLQSKGRSHPRCFFLTTELPTSKVIVVLDGRHPCSFNLKLILQCFYRCKHCYYHGVVLNY